MYLQVCGSKIIDLECNINDTHREEQKVRNNDNFLQIWSFAEMYMCWEQKEG